MDCYSWYASIAGRGTQIAIKKHANSGLSRASGSRMAANRRHQQGSRAPCLPAIRPPSCPALLRPPGLGGEPVPWSRSWFEWRRDSADPSGLVRWWGRRYGRPHQGVPVLPHAAKVRWIGGNAASPSGPDQSMMCPGECEPAGAPSFAQAVPARGIPPARQEGAPAALNHRAPSPNPSSTERGAGTQVPRRWERQLHEAAVPPADRFRADNAIPPPRDEV
jgi:hypothetical protein